MGGGFSFLLLLFLLHPGPGAAVSLLRYRYNCGDYGMQLLAYPSRGRTVHFKVMDEFGTHFEVANCSICLHWLNTGADGAIIFSSGYEGCHVLVKEDHYILRVQLEEKLLSGVPVASYEVNMTCPQPRDYEILTDGNLGTNHKAGQGNSVHQSQADGLAPLAQPGLLQHVSQSSLTVSGPQLSPQANLEQVHPVAQTQPILVRPGLQPQHSQALQVIQSQHGQGLQGLQPQPGMVRPITQPHQGLIRPGVQSPAQPGLRHPGGQTQNQPGMVHPGVQNQPGRLHLGLQTQNQPGMVHSGGQNQPGRLHLGLQTQNQPGMVHSGGQNQPGRLHPGLQTQNQPGLLHPGLQIQNQPGLVHPGAQNRPGHLRPGLQTPNQPGLVHTGVHAGAQTQAGFIRAGAQSQNQPGSGGSGLQSHSQTGLLRPGLQSQTGMPYTGSVRPGFQSQAGLVHATHSQLGLGHPGLQSRPGFVRPGLQAQLQSGLERPGLQPQAQPGLLRPGLQSQASLVQSTALFYPSAGAGTQLTREQCQVAVGRMPCVTPPGREACLQAGCCYDDMDRSAPCYYGNTATVQCLLEGHFVLVVPRGLATQPYNLDSVRLASSQPGCEPVRVTETFVMFRFPVTQCGTTVQVMEDQLIYENQLISTIDVQGSPRGSITRDSTYILQARCIYNASDLLPLRMEVAAPPSSTPMAMFGPLGLQLRIATDETYSSYHSEGDYPLVRVLRDPIYVEVRLLQKTDPNLVLVLHHCWASPSTDATSQPQWPILVDGCPFTGDNYRTQLVPMGPASPQLPFPSHYQRFVISTFTFVEPPTMAVLEGEVYISCSASVCHLSQPEPCRPSCQLGVPSRARRSLGERRRAEAMGKVTSRGLIVSPKVPKLRRG
ncbi:ZP1 protein, partial [Nycticryphes semicollaris]|nr:ZP1 protein [Nycticryphes semicollaris]